MRKKWSLGSSMALVLAVGLVVAGCGGGGGGGGRMADEMISTPEPTVPTEPTDTDEERIASARTTLAGIVTDARARAQAANLAAGGIQVHPDATATQVSSAQTHAGTAQDALTDIIDANAAGNAATTPAQAQSAVADARAALTDLIAARSAIASIESAVQSVASRRMQRETDEKALTGGSSLIKHIRDNKKVHDIVLKELSSASIQVVEIPSGNVASYPYHKGTVTDDEQVYPKPKDEERAVREVTITVGGTALSSHSKTANITGVGPLSNGFDLKDDADNPTKFATVYTDITVAKRTRTEATEKGADEGVDLRYKYVLDTDYLLAGIWLDDSGQSPTLNVFAYGSEPIGASKNFCTAADTAGTSSLERVCGETSGLNLITSFVEDDKSMTATYRGRCERHIPGGREGELLQGERFAHGRVHQ